MSVKNKRSGLSLFFIFLSHSYFLFDLFSIILFLELGLGLEWQYHTVTQQVTSDDMVTKTHDTGEEVEGSGGMTLSDLKAYTWLFRVGYSSHRPLGICI